MTDIGLSEAIAAVRAELVAAVEQGEDAEFHFPVNGVQLEFHVGVTKTGEGRTGGNPLEPWTLTDSGFV